MPERQFNVPEDSILKVNLTPATRIRIHNSGEARLIFAASVGDDVPDFSAANVAPIDMIPKQIAVIDLAEHFMGVPGADTLWVNCQELYGAISTSYT